MKLVNRMFCLGLTGLLVLASAPRALAADGSDGETVMDYSVDAQSYAIQNVLIRVVTPYPSDEPSVELKFIEALADRDVGAGSFTQVVPSSATPQAIYDLLKSHSFNTYLCIWPRRTVQWDPDQEPTPLNPLLVFLAKSPAFNAGQDTSVVKEMDLTKYNAIVFDVASGQRIWRGIIEMTSSPDLRMSIYYKELQSKILAFMTGIGLIPT